MSDATYFLVPPIITEYFLQHNRAKHSICSLLPRRQHYSENTFLGDIYSRGNSDGLHSPLRDNKIGGRRWSATGDNHVEANDCILLPCACAEGSLAVENG